MHGYAFMQLLLTDYKQVFADIFLDGKNWYWSDSPLHICCTGKLQIGLGLVGND